MKYKELGQLIKEGIYPIVTFKKGIENQEGYPENGMRAQIINVSFSDDDLIKLTFNYEHFDEFNKKYESANYYDNNKIPCLTARQKGFYKIEEDFYFESGYPIETDLLIEDSGRLKIYNQYLKSESEFTYVQWLENQLI